METRRSVIAGLAALPFGTGLPIAQAASNSTGATLGLFETWLSARRSYLQAHRIAFPVQPAIAHAVDFEPWVAATRSLDAATEALMSAPVLGPGDIALKHAVFARFLGADALPDCHWATQRAGRWLEWAETAAADVQADVQDETLELLRAQCGALQTSRGAIGRATHRFVAGTGPHVLDFRAKSLTIDGQPVHLSMSELLLVEVLARSRGGILSKAALCGYLFPLEERNPRVLDVYVCHARRILQSATGGHRIITTVWGQGYTFGEMYPDA